MKNLNDFILNIENSEFPPSEMSDLLKSLWWVKKGNWEKSHNIAQDIHDSDGSWVHAYLHRLEGDLGNAAYWYRKAGKPPLTTECHDEEWNKLVVAFLHNSD